MINEHDSSVNCHVKGRVGNHVFIQNRFDREVSVQSIFPLIVPKCFVLSELL